jgi:uncharacterized protein involved in copper resistance
MTRVMILALSMAASSAFAQHVPPDPPQNPLPHQSYEQMVEMMRMDDTERYGRVSVDQLEWQNADHADIAWDVQAYYGGDYNKLWLKTEGVHEQHEDDARVEVLWNRIIHAVVELADRCASRFRRRTFAHVAGARRRRPGAALVRHRSRDLHR